MLCSLFERLYVFFGGDELITRLVDRESDPVHHALHPLSRMGDCLGQDGTDVMRRPRLSRRGVRKLRLLPLERDVEAGDLLVELACSIDNSAESADEEPTDQAHEEGEDWQR